MEEQTGKQGGNSPMTDAMGRLRASDYLEPAVRIGALFLVIYWVVQIVAPFVPAVLWGIIIAVAADTLQPQ